MTKKRKKIGKSSKKDHAGKQIVGCRIYADDETKYNIRARTKEQRFNKSKETTAKRKTSDIGNYCSAFQQTTQEQQEQQKKIKKAL